MCKRRGQTSEAMNTVPPSYLSDSIVDTVSRPSFSLHVPVTPRISDGKLVLMLKQQWYTLIRPWIARYQRLWSRYSSAPVTIQTTWIPDISFGSVEYGLVIGAGELAHWMAQGWARIGCIADPITIAVDRETGTGEIIDGNGMLTSK